MQTFVAAFYGDTSVFVDSMTEPMGMSLPLILSVGSCARNSSYLQPAFSPHLVDREGRSLFHVLAMHDAKPYQQMMRVLARKCPDETGNRIEEIEAPHEDVDKKNRLDNAGEQPNGNENHGHDEEEIGEVEEENGEKEKEKEDAVVEEKPDFNPARQVHINWNARSYKGGLPLHVAVYEGNLAMTGSIPSCGHSCCRPINCHQQL